MSEAQRDENDFLAFFHRHVIPMVLVLKKGEILAPTVITTFVLSVREKWFLVTAGHCLKQIDDYKKEGYTTNQCFLMDSMGTGATHFEPIIFTFEQSKPQYIFSDTPNDKMDYGIIPLSEYYRGLLKANNICPLSEEVWKFQPEEPELFALIGVPGEFVQPGQKSVGVVTSLNFIDECERPEKLSETEMPMFYGKILLHKNQRSVKGMSGGPIFAFKQINGQYRYWLKALQSRWLEQSEIVMGCPTTFLGVALEKMIGEMQE